MRKFAIMLLALPLIFTGVVHAAENFGTPFSSTAIVPFGNNSTAFTPSENVRELLTLAPNAAVIYIRGRTSTGTASSKDEKLAALRALSARAYLVRQGVAPLKINVNFVSATDFIADNSTAEGRAQNQRVEIELVFVPTK